MADEPEDTLSIALEAAREAVEAKRSGEWERDALPPADTPPAVAAAQGLLPPRLAAWVGKSYPVLILFAGSIGGYLYSQADKTGAELVNDDASLIAAAIDKRIDAIAGDICQAQVDELRGEVEHAQEKPPTIADIREKASGDRARIFALERIHNVGEAYRARRRDDDEQD